MKKVIIVGAGRVGATLAESLVSERNEVTVIDQNRVLLNQLQDKHDLRVIQGNGAHPDVLRQAGADDADMLIAVSSLDEVNMLSCQVAHSIFNTPLKIARVRSEQYTKYHDQLFRKEQLPVDHIISPEQLVTTYIKRLIDYPGALQVIEFAEGKVSLVAVRASYGGKLVGHAIAALRKHIPNIDTRVAAIFRQGRPIRPLGSTIIEADDEVFFVADSKDIRVVMEELQPLEERYRNIMIMGGGNIGAGLARQLEDNHRIKLIELSQDRAEQLSSELSDKTLVLLGDATDQAMLSEERIEDIDAFIAVTNDDEANIMAALLAKRMGAKKTMVLIQRSAYVDLVQGGDIDVAISPQQATISALLKHIHRSDFASAYSLRRGAAEAIEAVARGDEKTSQVVGKEVSELKLPPGTTIGAVVRGSKVLIAHDNTLIQADDHVILFLVDKKYVHEIERLFAPGALYF